MIIIGLIILVVVTVIGVILAGHARAGNNLIPAASDLTAWQWGQDVSTKGRFFLEDGAIRCDSLEVDQNPWHLGLSHNGIVLESGHRYHIAFSAKADQLRKIMVRGDQAGHGGKWDGIGLEESVLLDTQWSNHEVTFTPIDSATGHVVTLPIFSVGDKVGTVWIKNVVVEKLD
jgi:hypothetical protein